MLHRGDQVPHFEVRDRGGRVVSYSTIWQRRNLVLIVLSDIDTDSTRRYLSEFADVTAAVGEHTTCIVTSDSVSDLPAPAVVVADKWGEVIHICIASDVSELSPPTELLDWINYVETKCPECEGEAR
jgi:peroxiredoxin